MAFAAQIGAEPEEVLAAAEEEMRRVAGGASNPSPMRWRWSTDLTVPIGVASNSDRWRLEVVLSSAGVRHLFDVTVAGDEVADPKPAPDIYLRAAALLETDPADCVVIEDSPTGVSAARCRRDDRRGRSAAAISTTMS